MNTLSVPSGTARAAGPVRLLVHSLLATLALVSGGLAVTAAPARAAYPRTSVVLYDELGNATVRGGIDWYDRSINFDGSLYSRSGCLRIQMWVYGATKEWSGVIGPDCGPDNGILIFDKTVTIDEPGGPQLVELFLQRQSGNFWMPVSYGEYARP